METRDVIAEVKQCFERGDILAALRFLNGLTPHRFTAMYLVNDDYCLNAFGIDKTDLNVSSLPDVPGLASYCAFTRQKGKPFVFDDAMKIPELEGHPAREEVRSYCAVPLVDNEGTVFGTICHFDYDVVPVSDQTVSIMEEVSDLMRMVPPSVYTEHANRTTMFGNGMGFRTSMEQ